jgi:U3 small nucleolar RNA-associated protein 3
VAGAAVAEGGDALRFKPNPDALLADAGLDDDEAGLDDDGDAAVAGRGGIYRPPKISAAHFEDREEAKARKAREKKAAKARKSEIVQALREEFDDAPLEMANIGSAAQYRDDDEDHRTRFEEENFLRLTVNKKERARLAKLRRGGGELAFESFEDFGDIDLSADRGMEEAAAGSVLKKRSLQEYLSSQEQSRLAKRRAGDSAERDVPARDRHTLSQAVNQRKQAQAARAARRGGGDDDEGDDGSGGGGEDDEYYREVAADKAAGKAARKSLYERPAKAYLEEAEVEEGSKREAGRNIVANRGLVPHRSRDKKNPRVKHRVRYEKARVKERTSFYGKQARGDAGGAYAGEATGIKANIARSRKL